MTSTPAEPDDDPQVTPSGDPTPDGDSPDTQPGHVPQRPQETIQDPEVELPLDSGREADPETESGL
jgi:hypothetical protein